MWWESQRKVIGVYTGATILCLLILVWAMQLWRARLTIPFTYSGADEFFYGMLAKGLLDNGWFLSNRFLGMPTGLDLHDFPVVENLHLFLMKFISYAASNYAVVLNLYYLLTFPLTMLTSLFVFRRFNISYPSAMVGSLLFAFLPYHFSRGEGHFFLSAYYLIPLMVMVILWVCLGEPLFHYEKDNRKLAWDCTDSKTASSLAICVLVASGGAYYTFFAAFLLLVAGAFALLHHRRPRQLLATGILLTVLSLTFVVNVSPSLMYAYQYGKSDIHERSPQETEFYGMKIVQLLLPVRGHRLSSLAEMRENYSLRAPLVNENDQSSLGVVGGFGFLVLLGGLVYRKPATHDAALFSSLSVLNIAAVLLATIGGFGALFAFLVNPQFRSINRMCVYIAFFSIFAVVLLLERLARRWAKSKTGRRLFYGLSGLILLLGTFDQTTSGFVPTYEHIKAEYRSDAGFIRRIEAEVPTNAMIFQLPYVPFPESGFVHRMGPYDHFRAYFHSKTLRWSFGTMRGREGDVWQALVAAKPSRELVETLAAAGFSGIYLDRYGYTDQGRAIQAELSKLLDIEPIVSPNQRLVFYNLEQAGSRAGLPRAKSSGPEIGIDAAGFGKWTSSPLGGRTSARPAVTVYQGELQVVVRGTDDSIYHTRLSAGAWEPWTSLGGLTRTAPAALGYMGKLWVFVRGTSNGVFAKKMSEQRWSGWEELTTGELTPSGPAAVAFGDALSLFVRGMNNGIYLNRFDGEQWRGWSAVPGEVLTSSTPAAVVFANRLYLFVRGMNDGIYVNRFDGEQWGGWSTVPGGGMTPSGPAVASTESRLSLIVRGLDNGIELHQLGTVSQGSATDK